MALPALARLETETPRVIDGLRKPETFIVSALLSPGKHACGS